MKRQQFGLLASLCLLVTPVLAYAQPQGPAATQLFLGPTGRVLPKGQGYFKGVQVMLPYAQGGLTDRFSIGAGIPLVGIGQIFVVSPKFQVQRSEMHSTSIGVVEALTSAGSFGVAYVAHTAELENGAVHVTLLAPISRYSAGSAVVMIGGEHRISDRAMFITENYIGRGGHPLVSGGVRLRGGHTTWDLGWLFQPGNPFGLAGSPMINMGWKF